MRSMFGFKYILMITAFAAPVLVFAAEEKQLAAKNQYGGKTVETKYAADDGKPFVRDVQYYDSKDSVKRAEYFYTPEKIKETGVVRYTVQYIFQDHKDITKYEVIFSPERFNETGLDKIIEYDDNGTVIQREYFNGKYLFSLSKQEYLNVGFYKMRNWEKYNSELTKKTNDKIILTEEENKNFAIVTYLKINKPVDDTDRDLIKKRFAGSDWDIDKILAMFKRKIYVQEGDRKYWIYMQEETYDEHLEENTSMVLIYYYWGSINGVPAFAMFTYWHPE